MIVSARVDLNPRVRFPELDFLNVIGGEEGVATAQPEGEDVTLPELVGLARSKKRGWVMLRFFWGVPAA